jgi:quercetin 2,3-dioxygenase
MEIVSYVLVGQLEHADTMGNKSTIGPGEIQVISGGTGFAHSEHNPSRTEPVHFLQIWIVPSRDQLGKPPIYNEGRFTEDERRGQLLLINSPDGRDRSVQIRQDADVYVSQLGAGQTLIHPLRPGRGAWVHVANGSIELNGERLGPGDGAAIEDENDLRLTGIDTAELVLFDLA